MLQLLSWARETGEFGNFGKKTEGTFVKFNIDAQRSIHEWGAGTLGMCKVTKSGDFPSVARIRAVNLHWNTAWACWEVLAHGAV